MRKIGSSPSILVRAQGEKGLSRIALSLPEEPGFFLESHIEEEETRAALIAWLSAYALRRPVHFDYRPPAGHRPSFAQCVLDKLRAIPFGATVTYGELAAIAGNGKAARAVGSVCRKNSLPLIVPCHRVVAARHEGGFSCGLEIKRRLLTFEANTSSN